MTGKTKVKNQNKKNKRRFSGKSALTAGLVTLATFFPALAGAQSLEGQKLPTIEITTDYETGSVREIPEYVQAWAYFDKPHFYSSDNFFITSKEADEIKNTLDNIATNKITSYSDFISQTSNFSENEKIAMMAAIGNSMYWKGYDDSDGTGEIPSLNVFFNKLKNILNDNEDLIGVCRQIGGLEQELAKSEGLTAAATTGMGDGDIGHVYDLIKTKNGLALLDGGWVTFFNTRDTEKALDIYQMNSGSLIFYHNFFEDSKLEYRVINTDGKNFLNLLGYDSTTNTTENVLLNPTRQNPVVSLNLNQKDYLTSGELNMFGFFAKAGEIRGDSLSSITNIPLVQIGYKGDFSLSLPNNSELSLKPSISVLYGDINYKKTDKYSAKEIFGASGDTILSYKNKDGLDLSFRTGYNTSINDHLYDVFYDFPLEAGVSFNSSIGKVNIQPYIIDQFKVLPYDLGTYNFAPQFTEFKAGVSTNLPIAKGASVSFNPYYALKLGEQEFGADAKLKTKLAEFDLGGYVSKSDYAFAPNTNGINAGVSVLTGENSKVTFSYENDVKDSDGETSGTSALSIEGKISY